MDDEYVMVTGTCRAARYSLPGSAVGEPHGCSEIGPEGSFLLSGA